MRKWKMFICRKLTKTLCGRHGFFLLLLATLVYSIILHGKAPKPVIAKPQFRKHCKPIQWVISYFMIYFMCFIYNESLLIGLYRYAQQTKRFCYLVMMAMHATVFEDFLRHPESDIIILKILMPIQFFQLYTIEI